MSDTRPRDPQRDADGRDADGPVDQAGEKAEEKAEEAATTARDSRAFGVLVVLGLLAYGVIHLTVAWIALQLAWDGGSGTSADQHGALQQLASTPVGPVLLWAVVVGLFALVLWRIGLAIWGFSWKRGWRRTSKRWGSLGQAIVYGALAGSAISVLLGSGSSSSRQRSMSGQLMSHPFGQLALGAVAAGIAGVGVYLIIKGLRKSFVDELQDGGTTLVVVLGRIGYLAKGVGYVIMGGIVGWAALRHDPGRAAGLDAALHTVKQQPFGPLLLTVLAAGFGCFGLYCFGWARRARRS